ncbi:MAG: hypothetical protein EBQ78_01080 [Betaproteobacteria bacterium]|nr:hypothetical protein [Betaproteobacteria bacterium]NBY16277.1 hypothetical protein [Betaproteobacteria bacterium]
MYRRPHLGMIIQMLGVLIFSVFSGAASAGAEPPTVAPVTSWHDGRQTRGLWLDPTREAEFATRGGGTVQPKQAPQAATQPSQAQRSPLFFDNPALNGTPRALPGGVLVELKIPTETNAARLQLESDGLTPVRAIVGDRIWLVASPPGLAALELANRLQQGGRYASAQPNWWQPRVPK